AVIASPYLYYFVLYRPYIGSVWNPDFLSADLLNFVVPTKLNQLGVFSVFDFLSARFNAGTGSEAGAFLAYPLAPIALLALRRTRRGGAEWLLGRMLLILGILSLGGRLVFRGEPTNLPLPWRILESTILQNAATVRFFVYIYLILGITTALWLARS